MADRTYYFYKAIRKTIIQFLDLFTNILVARYDNDGNIVKTVEVPVKFGPKEKAYYWIKEYSTEEKLPMISVVIQGIDFDSARMANRNTDVVIAVDRETFRQTQYPSPVPYTITFGVTIWALHMVDIDQILEQILPYFTPHIVMRITIPELETTIDVKVVFQSAIPDIPEDWGEQEWRVVRWTLQFAVQTYLFKAAEVDASGEAGVDVIKKTIANVYTDEDKFEARDTETLMLTASPPLSGGMDEIVYTEALGYDETAGILLYYEIFSNERTD
jgi:hypothetical protein